MRGRVSTDTSESQLQTVHLRVNERDHSVRIPANRLLLDLLREDLDLTGTKEWCGIGVCGACTVQQDGRPVSSCLLLAVQANGTSITTVEGLAGGDAVSLAELTFLQRAFIEHGGLQCGICTPGQLLSAEALLREHPTPDEATIRRWMAGNLCRCTGYAGIVRAIQSAAAEQAGVRGATTPH